MRGQAGETASGCATRSWTGACACGCWVAPCCGGCGALHLRKGSRSSAQSPAHVEENPDALIARPPSRMGQHHHPSPLTYTMQSPGADTALAASASPAGSAAAAPGAGPCFGPLAWAWAPAWPGSGAPPGPCWSLEAPDSTSMASPSVFLRLPEADAAPARHVGPPWVCQLLSGPCHSTHRGRGRGRGRCRATCVSSSGSSWRLALPACTRQARGG